MENLLPRVLACNVHAVESRLLAQSLAALENLLDITCIHEVESLNEQLSSEANWVVIVFDVQAKNESLPIVRRLRKSFPNLPIAVWTEGTVQSRAVEAFKAGAKGVISFMDEPEQIAKCVHSLSRGEVWATRRGLSVILDSLVKADRPSAESNSRRPFTPREEEVAKLVIEGFSNRQIAESLNLSESRVKNCILHIFKKCGISNRLELVHHLRRTGRRSNGRFNLDDDPQSRRHNTSQWAESSASRSIN